ncbi:chloride channel protein, partial [Tindallia californiensis]
MNHHIHLLIKEGREELGTVCPRIGAKYVYWHNLEIQPKKAFIYYQNIELYLWSRYKEYISEKDICETAFPLSGVFADSTSLFYAPSYSPDVTNVHWFILTGILAGVVSLLFMSFFGSIQKLFTKLPRKGTHPILGGILTGILLFYLPDVGGTGTAMIQGMINGSFPIAFLCFLLVGKMLATS